MRGVALLVVSLLPWCAGVAAPRIEVPSDLSQPEATWIRVTGLPPEGTVHLDVLRSAADDTAVDRSQADLTADRDGVVDTRLARPAAGTYAGVVGDGLFWSGQRASRLPDAPVKDGVRVVVRVGDAVVASATTRARPAPGTVTTEAVAAFPGAVFYRPAAVGRYPAIVVLGGSEGGAWVARSVGPLIAARGYAVLGLPYYAPAYDPANRLDGLPTTFSDIPVDRLALARRWLQERPDADASRIGLWGVSKGAEFALIAASRYPWIGAVAAVVPTDVVWEGWGGEGPTTSSFSFDGHPLPFVPYLGMDAALARAARGEAMGLRAVHAAGRAAHPDAVAAATIPVERFRGDLLVVGGGLDAIWPSADMAQAIADRRAAAGLPTTTLVFPEAGHGLGGPGSEPMGPTSFVGGTPQANAAARTEAWRATFALFDRALRASPAAAR